MEDTPKHDKKINNSKALPLAINIGAGAGMGGIVLVGGALVTATIVSVLAFKTRRSSSENINKSRSRSPDTQTVDAPNQLELMMKTNKDFSADSSPLDLHNSSRDGVTTVKEMQTTTVQNLTQDEKRNSGIDNDEQVESGDSYKDIIFSVVGEDQESSVDSVYESRDVDFEEQVVMADQIEEQKHLMLIDDEHVDAADEVITSTEEEYEAIEAEGIDQVPLGDNVIDLSEEENEEDQETVFINEEDSNPQLQFLEDEKEKDGDNDEEINLENCEGDLIDETGDSVSEVVMKIEEEAIDEDCVNQIEVQNGHQMQFLEEEEEEKQNDFQDGDKRDKTDHVNQITREENQQMQNESKQVKIEEEATACFNNMEDILAVDDQKVVEEDNPPTQLMNKHEEMIAEYEFIKKHEIPHVQLIEDEVEEELQALEFMQEEVALVANITNNKTEEKMDENETILGKEQNDKRASMDLAEGKKQAPANDWMNLQVLTWTVLVSIWCLFHWYSELPLPEVSYVGSLLFILILLGYQVQNRTTYLVTYE